MWPFHRLACTPSLFAPKIIKCLHDPLLSFIKDFGPSVSFIPNRHVTLAQHKNCALTRTSYNSSQSYTVKLVFIELKHHLARHSRRWKRNKPSTLMHHVTCTNRKKLHKPFVTVTSTNYTQKDKGVWGGATSCIHTERVHDQAYEKPCLKGTSVI